MSVLKLRRSTTAAAVPASLEEGEVAINEADGIIFFRLAGVVTAFSLVAANYSASGHTHAPSAISVSATDRILGRDTAGAGAAEEITPSALKTMLSLDVVPNFAEATAAQIRDNTADKLVTTDTMWAAADWVSLTDATTITPNFSAGWNFHVTLGGNRTLANPSNLAKPGQSGLIAVTQDGTGSRTLAYGSFWKFPGGAPTLSTLASSVDLIQYTVRSTTLIYATLLKALA